MTTNTMGRDEAGKAIRKRAMEGCPLARELLVLRGMCSCQGDEKSVDDAEDRYLELAVLRDAVPAPHAEIERLRTEVERLRADLMESDEIREKLGHLLTRTAAALKGEPPAGVWHSWHDLPERAAQLAEALRKLEAEVAAKQARIDALMLEYCPDEMTPEQIAEWARHQRPVSEQEAGAARQQELTHAAGSGGLTVEAGAVRITENGDERD